MLPLNENKIDQMCLILDECHKYVPTIVTQENISLPDGNEFCYDHENMFEISMGGDQLTVARARSAIAIRRTYNTRKDKLLGLVPVIEDWHSRMTLMQVR